MPEAWSWRRPGSYMGSRTGGEGGGPHAYVIYSIQFTRTYCRAIRKVIWHCRRNQVKGLHNRCPFISTSSSALLLLMTSLTVILTSWYVWKNITADGLAGKRISCHDTYPGRSRGHGHSASSRAWPRSAADFHKPHAICYKSVRSETCNTRYISCPVSESLAELKLFGNDTYITKLLSQRSYEQNDFSECLQPILLTLLRPD